MFQEILMDILVIIIEIVIIAIGRYVVMYLKEKLQTECYGSRCRFTRMLIYAAEQSFGEGKGADKKQEVMQKLSEYTKGKLSYEDMEYIIESIVYEMNNPKKSQIYDIP